MCHSIFSKSAGCAWLYQFRKVAEKSFPPSSMPFIDRFAICFGCWLLVFGLRIDLMSLIWNSQVHQKLYRFCLRFFVCVQIQPLIPVLRMIATASQSSLIVYKYTSDVNRFVFDLLNMNSRTAIY